MKHPQAPGERFEQLLRPHLDPCYRTAYRLTGSRADAQDLMQDLLIKLYQQFDQWSAMDDPLPWIRRVLYHLHIDHYRKNARTHGFNRQTLSPDEQPLEELESPGAGPLLAAENRQRQQRLLAALDTLNAEERLLVTLHLTEGHTLAEVAAMLDTPLGTLKARLHRGKARLKNLLDLQPFSEN